MNDVSEMSYAIGVTREVLSKREDHAARLADLWSKLENKLHEWQPHVFCLSAGQDLLSQWRAYGSGGRGFAIGFDLERLRAWGLETGSFALFPIEYSQAHQATMITSFVDASVQIERKGGLDGEIGTSFWFEVFMRLFGLLTCFKREHFSDEREWRAFTLASEAQLKFRPIRGAVVPYIELPFPQDAVTAVIRGPSLDDSFSDSLRLFLNHFGLGSARIGASNIPFRELTT